MKEAFVATVGSSLTEHAVEEVLSSANHDYDHTVKVVRAGEDGEALFGKIVFDSYADNCRDPQVGDGILAVGGYDLAALHDMAKSVGSGRYDPNDRDADQRVVRMLFHDFGLDCFNLLNRYMTFSVAFYDLDAREFVVGRGRDLGDEESYGNLFYGTLPDGALLFSNDETLLTVFVDEALPVNPCTYYAGGTFTTYRETAIRSADDAGLRTSYGNARGIIDMVNALLEQAADETLKLKMQKLFDRYFDTLEPQRKIESFVAENLDAETRQKLGALIDERIDELRVRESLDDELMSRFRTTLNGFLAKNATPEYRVIKLGERELACAGPALFHEKFEQVLTQVQLDEPVMLIGPAGSGKNYAIAQIAEGLGLPLHYTNNASNEFKLTGFIDAGGTYRGTEFYEAFANGGVFFLDEIDNSDPSALIVINSALANGYMAFPHKTIERHPDFRCVAAANTWGAGSNLQYVGRNVLDGATLDRFDMVFFDYDRRLERALYPNDELLEFLWAFREAVDECRVPHIVSTRAIGKAYKKAEYGMDIETILRTNVIRGLAQDDLNVIIGAMRDIDDTNLYLNTIKTIRVER